MIPAPWVTICGYVPDPASLANCLIGYDAIEVFNGSACAAFETSSHASVVLGDVV
jgi:hypothetical protein